MMINKLYSAVHNAAPSYGLDQKYYDEETLQQIAETKASGGMAYIKKKDAPEGSGVAMFEQGNVNRDTDDSLNFAVSANDRISSTPPAFRAQSEGPSSGVLNQQRIQQADVQSQVFISNYRLFLTKRAKVWYAMWREFFPYEMTVRITNKVNPDDADFFTVNKQVIDERGMVKKINDINSARFDIVFEESWQSQTMRDKTSKLIAGMMASQGAQADPVMLSVMNMWLLRLADAPQDFKNFMYERSQVLKKQDQQAQAQGAQAAQMGAAQQAQQVEKGGLEMDRMAQDIADREAQATTPELQLIQ
jgi:hypothetical protein